MPVGFKNRTDGNVQVAVDAVRAAAAPHAFAGIDPNGTPAILYTRGNADCHIILRGGKGQPNYEASSVAVALELLDGARLPRRVMIDLSHDNSGKDPERQPAVAADVGRQIASGNDDIAGVMLESFLVAGRQDLQPDAHPPELRHGQSITDGCIGWETTVEVLEGLAGSVRERNAAGPQTAPH
jgi:3-deoxy-7-phosphoheptulonate synthase